MNQKNIINIYRYKPHIVIRIWTAFVTIGLGVNTLGFYLSSAFRNKLDAKSYAFFQNIVPILFLLFLIVFINLFFGRKISFTFFDKEIFIKRRFKKTIVIPYEQLSSISFHSKNFMIDEYFKWEAMKEDFKFFSNYALDIFMINRGINITFLLHNGKKITIRRLCASKIREIKKIHEITNLKMSNSLATSTNTL